MALSNEGVVAMMDLGINLAFPTYYTPIQLLADRRITASAPRIMYGTGVLGPNGWPVGPCQHAATYYLDVEPTEYKVIVTKGKASQVKITQPSNVKNGGSNISKDFDATGVATFTAAGYSNNGISISVVTTDPGETRWAIVRSDELDVWKADPLAFSPSALKIYTSAGFKSFRAMDLMKTNDNKSSGYAEGDPLNNFQGVAGGVPLFLIAKLAIQTGMSPWICVPTRSTDDEIRSIFTRVEILRSMGIPVRVEFTNEVWNAKFMARAYAISQEALLYPSEDPSKMNGQRWYGYRAAQISKIAQGMGWRQGQDFYMVLAGQTVNPDNLAKAVTGIKLAGGDVSTDFDEYAITNYIWGKLVSEYSVTVPLVRAKDLAGGFDSLMNAPYPYLSAASMPSLLSKNVTVATGWGFKRVVGYEGNEHLNVLTHFSTDNLVKAGYTDVTQDMVLSYFASLHNDPRMADVTAANLKAAEDAGLTLLEMFNDQGKFGLSGCFGLWGTPSWGAISQFIADRQVKSPYEDLMTRATDLQQQVNALAADVKAAMSK